MPIHRLFRMTNDNKIKNMITYDNDLPWAEMRRSYAPRTNGIIYNNHDNINTVRLMMGALENGDVDKAFSYFTEDATFTNLDMERGKSHTVAEEKEMFKGLTSYGPLIVLMLGDIRIIWNMNWEMLKWFSPGGMSDLPENRMVKKKWFYHLLINHL